LGSGEALTHAIVAAGETRLGVVGVVILVAGAAIQLLRWLRRR
jgi:hypothetical protein